MNFPRIKQLSTGVPQLTEAILYQVEADPNCEFELNEDKTMIRKRLKDTTVVNSQVKSVDKNQGSEAAV